MGQQQRRIAVIGDVHDQWSAADGEALMQLGVDLALFVGDFGNEAVEIVGAIAALPLPKAVILGNHDAWFSATEWGRKKCPYNRTVEDRVTQQLNILGPAHVGYGRLELPNLGLTIVGGRPFSWGGAEWRNRRFYCDRYGINNLSDSAERISQAVREAQESTLIFVGHCGPTGLGDTPESPCGKDWNPIGGDFGEPDLAAGIALAQQSGKAVPLVTFGHMHHRLRHRKDRLRQRLAQDRQGTLHLNAACVPRVRSGPPSTHHFSLVSLEANQVQQVEQIWVTPTGLIRERETLYCQTTATLSS